MLCTVWTTAAAVTAAAGGVTDALNDRKLLMSQVDTACESATDILHALSGRQYSGTCTTTVRPATRPREVSRDDWDAVSVAYTGVGYLGAWGVCFGGDHGACSQRRELDLGVYPLQSVDAVMIGADVVDPSTYAVVDGRLLVSQDPWPLCQDITVPAGEPGAFAVDVTYGSPPPSAGVTAAAVLAGELALNRANLANRLPRRLQSVSRQGVSWTVLDPMQFLDNGLTGLYEVDLFLRAFNPQRQRTRPRTYSPDTVVSRRRGGTQ